MDGRRYYTFKPKSLVAQLAGTDVRFFVIDTEQFDRAQLDREMSGSNAEWKIAIFHRPIYTSGRYAFAARGLRRALEPILVKHGVKAAFSGHEHFYQRAKRSRESPISFRAAPAPSGPTTSARAIWPTPASTRTITSC